MHKEWTFTLSPAFYDDTRHCGCFDMDPHELRRTARELTVVLHIIDAAELYSRAQSYVDGAAEYIAEGCGGLVSSARATLRRMRAQGFNHDDYRAGIAATEERDARWRAERAAAA